MRRLRKFFAEFDMFSAKPTLRAHQQPQSSSIFSGVLSFLLTLFFSYIFLISSIDILSHKDIKSSQTQSRLSGNQVKAQSVFFAIRVGYLPANISIRYFEIGYYLITEDGQNITFELEVCRKEQWSKLGDSFQSEFQQYKIGQFFCPNQSQNLSLFQVYYANNPRYIIIYIRPCTLHEYCENQSSHKQFVQDMKSKQGAVFLLAYFLDQKLSPYSFQAASYTINTDVQLAFTTARGIIGAVEFASYKVETDIGIMPVVQRVVNEGNFVHSFGETSIELKNYTDNYALIYLNMNRRFIHIQRVVGKIDQMLSYAGGLFAIIAGLLAIFLRSYNQYRYELMVAEGVFHENQEGHGINQKSFHFLKYIKYTIFDWIQILLCISLNWQDCHIIEDTRKQAKCHMDVTNFFHRIQVMDNSLLHLMSKKEKDCLSLVKPANIGKIKYNRLISDYYDAVTMDRQSMTLEQYLIYIRMLELGVNLDKVVQNQQRSSSQRLEKHLKQLSFFEDSSKFVELQQLSDKDKVLQIIFEQFTSIQEQADKIELTPEILQIQKQLAQHFSNLNYETRSKIQKKIPIIILKRFKKYINFNIKQQQEIGKLSQKLKIKHNVLKFQESEKDNLSIEEQKDKQFSQN